MPPFLPTDLNKPVAANSVAVLSYGRDPTCMSRLIRSRASGCFASYSSMLSAGSRAFVAISARSSTMPGLCNGGSCGNASPGLNTSTLFRPYPRHPLHSSLFKASFKRSPAVTSESLEPTLLLTPAWDAAALAAVPELAWLAAPPAMPPSAARWPLRIRRHSSSCDSRRWCSAALSSAGRGNCLAKRRLAGLANLRVACKRSLAL
mmetsp:Transcript_34896/g.96311  ORF Transcript_34896/g.96311 Transcript_34896/m.96311 type:complete len:205 (-) Transcript_34896:206-820(-)